MAAGRATEETDSPRTRKNTQPQGICVLIATHQMSITSRTCKSYGGAKHPTVQVPHLSYLRIP